MEINEAIKRIEDHMCVHKIGRYPHTHLGEALDLAITALKEKEKREYNPKLTLQDLQQLTNKFIWWDNFGGMHCQCKNGFVVTEVGTFSFDFVIKNGSAYLKKPICGKDLNNKNNKYQVKCAICKFSRPLDRTKSPEKYFREDCIVCECEDVVGDEPMIYLKEHYCSFGKVDDGC